MEAKRSVQQYSSWLLIAFGGLLLMHIAVIAGLLPAGMVWGGQYQAGPELVKMEVVASVVTVVFALIVAGFSGRVSWLPDWLSKVGMYILIPMFLLSVVGSYTSAHPVERYGLSLYSLALAVMGILLLRAKARMSTRLVSPEP